MIILENPPVDKHNTIMNYLSNIIFLDAVKLSAFIE